MTKRADAVWLRGKADVDDDMTLTRLPVMAFADTMSVVEAENDSDLFALVSNPIRLELLDDLELLDGLCSDCEERTKSRRSFASEASTDQSVVNSSAAPTSMRGSVSLALDESLSSKFSSCFRRYSLTDITGVATNLGGADS